VCVLSDERTGLSFIYAAGTRQRSLSWVPVPLDAWPYFTVSDLRLSSSSPPTTRRVTVEVFDPASTQGTHSVNIPDRFFITTFLRPRRKHSHSIVEKACLLNPLPSNGRVIVSSVRLCGNVFTEPLPSNGSKNHKCWDFCWTLTHFYKANNIYVHMLAT
jgi:hypothetical protein